jgi:GH24 family phage-related lysozyme (muramidase)
MFSDTLMRTVLADLGRWEGRFKFMYLDTKGLVTVGVGKMLPDVGAAQCLPFVVRATGAPAGASQIAADFNSVKAQSKALLAQHYQQYTALDLPDPAIDELLRGTVTGFETQLAGYYSGWEAYPDSVQRALLDMIYNLGLPTLKEYQQMKAAIEKRDWKGAAAQCHRNGPSQERNDWTRDLFLAADGSNPAQ